MEEGPINPWVISMIPEGRQIESADLLNLGFNPQDNELGLENLKEAYEVLTNVQKKRVLPAYNVLKILQRALRNSIGKEMQITNKMAELGIDLGTLRWLSDNEKVDTSDKLLKVPVDAREDILLISPFFFLDAYFPLGKKTFLEAVGIFHFRLCNLVRRERRRRCQECIEAREFYNNIGYLLRSP